MQWRWGSDESYFWHSLNISHNWHSTLPQVRYLVALVALWLCGWLFKFYYIFLLLLFNFLLSWPMAWHFGYQSFWCFFYNDADQLLFLLYCICVVLRHLIKSWCKSMCNVLRCQHDWSASCIHRILRKLQGLSLLCSDPRQIQAAVVVHYSSATVCSEVSVLVFDFAVKLLG